MGTIAATGRPLILGFEISKVDEERRYVGGYATVEEPDKQGDIVDYQASVDAFSEWPGNIREQHDKTKAVGKAIEIQPDPAGKRIWLGAYISRSRDGEDTWTKVREGILKGFSIKGQVLDHRLETSKGTGRPLNRITRYRLDEVSLVDNPACPSALIHVVKSVDGVPCATEVLKRNFDENVGGGVDRDKIPDEDFAGPDRSFPIVTPGDVEDAARSLGRTKHDPEEIRRRIIAIARRKGAEFVARLPDAWRDEEKAAGPDLATGARRALEKHLDARAMQSSFDLQRLSDLLGDLAVLISDAVNRDGSGTNQIALDAVRQAFAAIGEAVQERVRDLLSAAPPPPPPPAPPSETPPGPSEVEAAAGARPDGATLLKDAPAGSAWPEPAGDEDEEDEEEDEEPPAKPQAGSRAIELQQLHDLAVALGAECKCNKPNREADEDSEKSVSGDLGPLVESVVNQQLEKAAGMLWPSEEKLNVARESLEKALGEIGQVKAVISRLDDLEKRLAAIEQSPDPGAQMPALRAIEPGSVEKALGDAPTGNGVTAGLTAADEVTLAKLAEKATHPFVKQQIGYAQAYLELQKLRRG